MSTWHIQPTQHGFAYNAQGATTSSYIHRDGVAYLKVGVQNPTSASEPEIFECTPYLGGTKSRI